MKVKKGDIVYCKRATTKILSNNTIIVIEVGDKCIIQDAYYLGNTMLLTVNGYDVFFIVEKYHIHFESLKERRERIIEDLI